MCKRASVDGAAALVDLLLLLLAADDFSASTKSNRKLFTDTPVEETNPIR